MITKYPDILTQKSCMMLLGNKIYKYNWNLNQWEEVYNDKVISNSNYVN